MKSLLNSILFIFIPFILFSSCKKESSIIRESISGKWNIKKDSTYAAIGYNNHEVIYYGQTHDYFNFTSDGHVYIRENSVLDNLTYNINSDSIVIPDFGYKNGIGKARFQSSAHCLTITTGYFFTPGGIFGRTVYLER
jgi:hypothetical protein